MRLIQVETEHKPRKLLQKPIPHIQFFQLLLNRLILDPSITTDIASRCCIVLLLLLFLSQAPPFYLCAKRAPNPNKQTRSQAVGAAPSQQHLYNPPLVPMQDPIPAEPGPALIILMGSAAQTTKLIARQSTSWGIINVEKEKGGGQIGPKGASGPRLVREKNRESEARITPSDISRETGQPRGRRAPRAQSSGS